MSSVFSSQKLSWMSKFLMRAIFFAAGAFSAGSSGATLVPSSSPMMEAKNAVSHSLRSEADMAWIWDLVGRDEG